MEQMYYGPLWPLGHIAPSYAGAGEALTVHLTGRIETTEYFEAAAMALIISPVRHNGATYVANTSTIYLMTKAADGTFNALTNPENVIMAIVPTAGIQQFPAAQYGSNRYKLNDLGIDNETSGDGAFVCAIMQ